jgi:hypothetical protein
LRAIDEVIIPSLDKIVKKCHYTSALFSNKPFGKYAKISHKEGKMTEDGTDRSFMIEVTEKPTSYFNIQNPTTAEKINHALVAEKKRCEEQELSHRDNSLAMINTMAQLLAVSQTKKLDTLLAKVRSGQSIEINPLIRFEIDSEKGIGFTGISDMEHITGADVFEVVESFKEIMQSLGFTVTSEEKFSHTMNKLSYVIKIS